MACRAKRLLGPVLIRVCLFLRGGCVSASGSSSPTTSTTTTTTSTTFHPHVHRCRKLRGALAHKLVRRLATAHGYKSLRDLFLAHHLLLVSTWLEYLPKCLDMDSLFFSHASRRAAPTAGFATGTSGTGNGGGGGYVGLDAMVRAFPWSLFEFESLGSFLDCSRSVWAGECSVRLKKKLLLHSI